MAVNVPSPCVTMSSPATVLTVYVDDEFVRVRTIASCSVLKKNNLYTLTCITFSNRSLQSGMITYLPDSLIDIYSQVPLQRTTVRCNYNALQSGAITTHYSQVPLQRTTVRCHYNALQSGAITTHYSQVSLQRITVRCHYNALQSGAITTHYS